MTRRYGRSPRGQRAYAKVPFGGWKRLSVLGALGMEGVLATMSIEAATDSVTFRFISSRCCCRCCASASLMPCW